MLGNFRTAWVLIGVASLVGGCLPAPPADVGGLEADDFEQISLHGFDPADNQLDKNDYAWSMAYFQPDGRDEGHVYVGTGNMMLNLMFEGLTEWSTEDKQREASSRNPEIRRYRRDLGPMTWETSFDYREMETDPNVEVIGFRFLAAYRAQSDGVNYLYASLVGDEASLWRSATGDPGSWQRVWTFEDSSSVRWLAEHDGILYIARTQRLAAGGRVGAIWATDGDGVWPVMEDGFGNPKNLEVMSLMSYNGWLYAGTLNKTTGFEVWKLAGPGGGVDPIQVVANGGPDPANETALTMCVFQDKLYVGTMINHVRALMAFKGCDLIRIDENDQWETVVGPGSLSGYGSGFDHWSNVYVWSMVEHDGWFYAGTYDQMATCVYMLENLGLFLPMMMGVERTSRVLDVVGDSGGDLYKTQDGVTWYPVEQHGFGNVGDYGFRNMVSAGGYLYAGMNNPFDGLVIYRGSDGD